MSITITDLYDGDRNLYQVHFDSDDIETLVTYDPEEVDEWIFEIESIHSRRLHRLVVGLDVEWRPNFNRSQRNPVATLQLCVGRRCLIFQIYQYFKAYNTLPVALTHFLGDEDYTFVGVGIAADVQKLEDDYYVTVGGRIVDLSRLAAQYYQMNRLNNAGLKELASLVLRRDVEKPRSVTLSRWDKELLNLDQVSYACVDAFVSFDIGLRLNA